MIWVSGRPAPDLCPQAPAGFFLFPHLKADIKGARFADMNAIQDRVTTVLWSILQEFSLIVYGSCTNVVKRVLWRMTTILKGDNEYLFVSFVLFFFLIEFTELFRHTVYLSDITHIN